MMNHPKHGALALEWCKVRLPIQVLRSAAGWYLGTFGEAGPTSRESVEYFRSEDKAKEALASGNWTQRANPRPHTTSLALRA